MQRATASKQSPQQTDSPYLTEAEAADYMRLSPRTLTKWRSIGRGPRFTKAGRLARYRMEDIEAWLAKRASEEGA